MSNTKLTLSLNKAIIEEAKKYARDKNTSLSQLIENYLNKIISDSKPVKESTPIFDKLSGVISLPDDFNMKEDYAKHLKRKYK